MEYKYFYNPNNNGDQFFNICIHKKRTGIIKLNQKKIIFDPFDSVGLNPPINIDDIVQMEIKSVEDRELLKIETSNKESFIFGFRNFTPQEEKTFPLSVQKIEKLEPAKARNMLHELLQTRNHSEDENILKQCFIKKIPEDKQLEILNILSNRQLLESFNELCVKNILKYEEYKKFMKSKYNYEFIKGISINQNINLSSKFLF